MLNTSKKQLVDRPGWLILFAIVVLDSLLTYFGRNFTGLILPVNALLPLWLIIMILHSGIRPAIPPVSSISWLSIAVLGFLIGIMIIPENTLSFLFQIATALIAFVIGVAAARWNSNETKVVKLFLTIGGLYVLVCTVALLKLVPSILPLIVDVGNYQGRVVARPSVTIDQNFQIFYVFIPALVLALKFKLKSGGLALFFTVCAIFVLAQLQTRSGIILIANVVFLSLLASIFYPQLGRRKVIVLPIVVFILIVINLEQILYSSQEIIQRFSQQEMVTLHGRLYSAQYLFVNLLNPEFWLPYGEADFVSKTGDVPHFTATAFYLHGGILSLMAWVSIFMLPLITLTRMFFKGKLDGIAIMFFIAAITSFIAQLSLNAPYFEQIWLWAGAAIGTIKRLQEKKPDNNKEEKPEINKKNKLILRYKGTNQ